ncbi:MAG: hypothetical protein WDA27_08070 [Actinomycetota bacterium]
MTTILVEDKEQANLLSLILETVLVEAQKLGRRLPSKGRIGVKAGSMATTLAFSSNETRIISGARPPVQAKLSAPLSVLAVLGRGKFATALRGGKVRFSGNLLLLGRLALVLRPAGMEMPLGPSCPVRARALRWLRPILSAYNKVRYRKIREVK